MLPTTHGAESTAANAFVTFFSFTVLRAFLGPYGLEKWYDQRVSVIKTVGDMSSTTAYPRGKGGMDFFSLEIINPWLLWAVSCRSDQGQLGVGVCCLSSDLPSPLCHGEVEPLEHSGGSFHLTRGPEPWRVFQV